MDFGLFLSGLFLREVIFGFRNLSGVLHLRLPQSVEPAGEPVAGKKEPEDHQGNQKQRGEHVTEKRAQPRHHRFSALAAQTASESIGKAEWRRDESKNQGGSESACDRQQEGSEHRIVPSSCKKPDRDGEQDDNQGKTAEAEAMAHQKIGPSEAHLATQVAHIHGDVSYRRSEKALVRFPCEEV